MPREYTPRTTVICVQCAHAFAIPPNKLGSRKFCQRTCKTAASRIPAVERLAACTTKTETCWLVPPKGKPGYGLIGEYRPDGTRGNIALHRLAWELASGEPIPPGQEVCHTCDVRNCVRNDDSGVYVVGGIELPRWGHLFLGTPRLNMIDRSAKGRANTQRGTQHHHSRLTDAVVQELRARHAAGGITQRELAAMYGIAQPTVSEIVRRRKWTHIT